MRVQCEAGAGQRPAMQGMRPGHSVEKDAPDLRIRQEGFGRASQAAGA
jgi:hypothetical protein